MKNSTVNDLAILVTAQDFQKQVHGYGLTTANILYRRPDHPWLLQSYVWQNYDLSTHISLSCSAFWSFGRNLSKVPCILAHSHLVRPAEIKTVGGIFRLH